ncbi:uncharacterized protein LOC104901243 [Beta vulgaris subsp. vulgaris]|uniref:uncharacterized protein LOC104901243 n=1 Tax=Beta vulgaris subsp. vulgaris TaxID=3555 RepID=UPI0025470656|nr:uncharacterized protein LOC104901243 [Beta vulgaris subsp. vulgaris]
MYHIILDTVNGKNYLSWVLDAEIHLDAKDLGDTIKAGNKATSQNKAKVIIFLRHHLHEGLKIEYLTVKDPQVLWSNLKERITSQLKLCGEKITDAEMLEKTYTTFHANNVVLQTQYREKEFKKYSELISSNAASHNGKEKHHANNSGRGRGRGYGHGRGRGRGYGYGRGRGRGGSFKNSYSHQKRDNKDDNKQEKDKNENVTNVCYRCGGKGHWSRTCRTPKHLVDLYQQSLKQKGKKVETNLVYEDGEGDFDCGNTTHLEVADFFTTPEGNN